MGEVVKLEPIKNISINPLDALLSAYDRNHDFKIDNKDIIYNYIFLILYVFVFFYLNLLYI
ncbi:hypothetical protein [Campylobacter corcagiensis]|uniref:Uncharacterized protein n=1 Tax=Campylobacter corcagiensis TaxID=1448857 RepID=A0A7M1LFY6_9BACT|nr:hypothetical protein [Campylobacter corcagiensis]QKF64477.1 hypothetical protein CCORG_0608 [Campylobacter corcagiensis]QOQ87340.1 hypothetical protein IMC76_00520 [Campylobacter corcagiensis]